MLGHIHEQFPDDFEKENALFLIGRVYRVRRLYFNFQLIGVLVHRASQRSVSARFF